MTLPASPNTIRMSDIQTEFARGGANPISLSEYYKGGAYVNASPDVAPNVPVSGVIRMSNFHGAQAVFSVNVSGYPSSNTAGDWTNPTLAYSDDGSYASCSTSELADFKEFGLGTFGFDTLIPVGKTVTACTVTARIYAAATGDSDAETSVTLTAGGGKTCALTTSSPDGWQIKSGTFSSLPTRAELLNSALNATISAFLAFISSGGGIHRIDYIRIDVTYV